MFGLLFCNSNPEVIRPTAFPCILIGSRRRRLLADVVLLKLASKAGAADTSGTLFGKKHTRGNRTMPYYQVWEEFARAAEKLYLTDPMKVRLSHKRCFFLLPPRQSANRLTDC